CSMRSNKQFGMVAARYGNAGGVGLLLLALAMAACASTTLTHSWESPDYKGPALKKLMVVGVSKQSGMRRSFEDGFVKQLKAAGVDAVPSYTLIPEDAQATETQLSQAVKQAGADGALVTRL